MGCWIVGLFASDWQYGQSFVAIPFFLSATPGQKTYSLSSTDVQSGWLPIILYPEFTLSHFLPQFTCGLRSINSVTELWSNVVFTVEAMLCFAICLDIFAKMVLFSSSRFLSSAKQWLFSLLSMVLKSSIDFDSGFFSSSSLFPQLMNIYFIRTELGSKQGLGFNSITVTDFLWLPPLSFCLVFFPDLRELKYSHVWRLLALAVFGSALVKKLEEILYRCLGICLGNEIDLCISSWFATRSMFVPLVQRAFWWTGFVWNWNFQPLLA